MVSDDQLRRKFLGYWARLYPEIELAQNYRATPCEPYSFPLAHPDAQVAIVLHRGLQQQHCCVVEGWTVYGLGPSHVRPKSIHAIAEEIALRLIGERAIPGLDDEPVRAV
ncbi:MAG: hypothetical protein AAFY17_09380 [Cyanobacteria bacterium J06642_11]